jgi:multidrug transporter EmrE-like cation transporter
MSQNAIPLRGGERPARVPPKDFLLLHLTLLLYAVASVFAKAAGGNLAARDYSPTFIFLVLETLTLDIYAVLWQQTLKRMPLSFAYSNKAVCTLWSCLFGLIFFGESLTLGKALGIVVVLAGVWLVVSEHE